MQKVPGVVSVKVSLNDGLTTLDLAAENTVTLERLRQLIRNNGFVTNESRIVARGTATASGDTVVFEVRNTRERLTLEAAANAAAFDQLRSRLKSSATMDVVVTGDAATKDPKALMLAVVSVAAP